MWCMFQLVNKKITSFDAQRFHHDCELCEKEFFLSMGEDLRRVDEGGLKTKFKGRIEMAFACIVLGYRDGWTSIESCGYLTMWNWYDSNQRRIWKSNEKNIGKACAGMSILREEFGL